MGIFQWVANFFIILCGPPGIVNKSTTIRIGKDLVRGTNLHHIGPSSVSWQALLDAFEESCHAFAPDPAEPATTITQAPLSLWVSEFGNFFDPSNREQVDLLVDAWDGQKEVFERRTRKDGTKKISGIWVTMIACVTPSWMQENFSTGLIGGGFASRTIIVYGDKKKKVIAYPGLTGTGVREELRQQLIEDLRHIHSIRGPMVLTPEAVEWGTEWYERHYANAARFNNKRMEGYNARLQTHLHKVAMILSLSTRDDRVITKEHLQLGEKLLAKSEAAMEAVLAELQSGKRYDIHYASEILLALERTGGSVSKNKLFSNIWRTIGSSKTFDQAINDLMRAGKIRATALPGGDMKLDIIKETKP